MQEWLESSLPPVILAVMGGIADYLMSEDHSFVSLLISMFLAGFAGYMILLLCREYGVSEGITGVACGIGGMSSKSILQLFKREIVDRIKVHLKKDLR